jgi:hypothetical protein
MSTKAFEELLESLVKYLKSQSQASSPSRETMESIGTPAEREVAKLIVDYLKSKGYSFYRLPPAARARAIEPPLEEPSILEEGKFYSRQGRNLFIYVRERGDMIDLDLFPDELGLFGHESAWRLNNKAIIVGDAEESSLDRAEVILQENGFRRWDHPEEILVHYFALGDFSVFDEQPSEAQVLGF